MRSRFQMYVRFPFPLAQTRKSTQGSLRFRFPVSVALTGNLTTSLNVPFADTTHPSQYTLRISTFRVHPLQRFPQSLLSSSPLGSCAASSPPGIQTREETGTLHFSSRDTSPLEDRSPTQPTLSPYPGPGPNPDPYLNLKPQNPKTPY